MIKKIIAIGILVSSLYGVEYKDENKTNLIDLNMFVGLEYGISYNNNDKFDDLLQAYGFYIGTPIYNGIELIAKYKQQNSSSYDSEQKSITVNFPISGKYTREVYVGAILGQSSLEFSDAQITNKSINDKKYDGSFYGLHLGKRFNYTRNFAIRIEAEYLYYGDSIKAGSNNYDITDSAELLYALEYRF